MTMTAFAAGELIRDPEARAGANGNPYVTALVRVGEALVSVTAFDDTLRERLAGLERGEMIAVSGRLQARPYLDRDGKPQAGLSILAGEIMTAPARRSQAAARARREPQAAAPDFDDELNF